MNKIKQICCSDAGVIAYRIEGYEEHGLVFLADRYGDACGAQCNNCNNILWTSNRKNSILNEKTPASVPDSGLSYSNYFYDKLERFLKSLPECPKCHSKHYDTFFTNTVYPRNMVYPRFEDGTSYPDDNSYPKGIPVDTSDILIWWYIEDPNGE